MTQSIIPCPIKGQCLQTDFDLSRLFTILPTLTAPNLIVQLQQLNNQGHRVDLKTLSPTGEKTFLSAVASTVNVDLLREILALDLSIVDLGNEFGRTALFSAVNISRGVSKENIPNIVTLLKFGANVNIATTKELGSTPIGATPLWAAAEKADVIVIKLLLKWGARIQIPLSPKGQTQLLQAYRELVEQRVAERRKLEEGILSVLHQTYPTVLLDLIQNYKCPDYSKEISKSTT